MAPFTSESIPLSLSTPNDTVLVMQDPGGPWTMDLNTSVTIVFGVLGLILQAGQICYGRRQITRMSLQNEEAPNTEMVFNIPNDPMSQRGQTQPSHSSRGSSRSMRLRQWSPPVENPPTGHPRQPDKMVERCALPPPPDNIRRRHAQTYSNRGQRGGTPKYLDRARYLSQYNKDQNPQYLGQGYEVYTVC